MTPSNNRGSLSPSLFLVVVVVAIFLVVVVVVTSRGNSTAIFRNIPSPDATRRDELLLSLRSHKATPWFHENAPTFVPSLSVSTLTHALRNKSVVSFLPFSLFFPSFRVRSTSLSPGGCVLATSRFPEPAKKWTALANSWERRSPLISHRRGTYFDCEQWPQNMIRELRTFHFCPSPPPVCTSSRVFAFSLASVRLLGPCFLAFCHFSCLGSISYLVVMYLMNI